MISLLVLSHLGFNITPLLAGASVIGLAISFGSQALVKDIVTGVLFLAEDSFRIGEYIVCGNSRGPVEGFTLRSVRLRHQDGQIFTVPFGQIGEIVFGTDGSGYRNLIVEPNEAGATCLTMNGRSIFEFMLTTVPAEIERSCAANGLDQDAIDIYLLHQASNHMLSQLIRRTGLDPAIVPIRMGDTGNLVSSSIPFLIAELAREGGLAGKTALLSGFGVGLSWATGVVRFDDDPVA
jgi:hypothetical protein